MDETAIRFARAAQNADIALLYYSGHALQFGGVNYLAPIDTQLKDVADLRRLVRLDDIVADLQQAKNLRILVLDACRDNPFANELRRSLGSSRAVSLQRGLAKLDNAQGMIVAYATQAGQTAEDGDGRNSPYKAPEEIGTIFRRISSDVYETTKHGQLPELSLSIIGEFYLRGKVEVALNPQQSGLSRTLLGTPFNAAEVPFLCDQCREQIRTSFVGQPAHSALVLSFDGGYYWSTGPAYCSRCTCPRSGSMLERQSAGLLRLRHRWPDQLGRTAPTPSDRTLVFIKPRGRSALQHPGNRGDPRK
jgi:hypothetical protein